MSYWDRFKERNHKTEDEFYEWCEYHGMVYAWEQLKETQQQLAEAEKVMESLEINLLHEVSYEEWIDIKRELRQYQRKYKEN